MCRKLEICNCSIIRGIKELVAFEKVVEMCYNVKYKIQKGAIIMLVVRVATQKPVKIEAIEDAFKRFFDQDVSVIGVNVSSGVSEQPIGEDVFIGAENRINALKELGGEYDFLVSCEGGIVNQYGYLINTQIVLIENKEGIRGIGMSQGYQIPNKYIQELRTTTIARIFDRLFGENKGGLRFLTNGIVKRKALIEQSTIMALSYFNWI